MKQPKIIIVDDDENILSDLNDLFETEDIYIQALFRDTKSAYKYLQDNKCDFVILDVNFDPQNAANIDGLNLLSKINKYFKGIKVIIMTASVKKGEYTDKIRDLNPLFYVAKNERLFDNLWRIIKNEM